MPDAEDPERPAAYAAAGGVCGRVPPTRKAPEAIRKKSWDIVWSEAVTFQSDRSSDGRFLPDASHSPRARFLAS